MPASLLATSIQARPPRSWQSALPGRSSTTTPSSAEALSACTERASVHDWKMAGMPSRACSRAAAARSAAAVGAAANQRCTQPERSPQASSCLSTPKAPRQPPMPPQLLKGLQATSASNSPWPRHWPGARPVQEKASSSWPAPAVDMHTPPFAESTRYSRAPRASMARDATRRRRTATPSGVSLSSQVDSGANWRTTGWPGRASAPSMTSCASPSWAGHVRKSSL
mmetsp:Transcript_26422/g.88518  ORF Transcript_26422/g.88518 Transcript_26422/m.88518 type:complete len:225 (-) Transcript_26422:288-962(-)